MPGAARDAPCGLRDADHGGRDAPPYPLLPSAPGSTNPRSVERMNYRPTEVCRMSRPRARTVGAMPLVSHSEHENCYVNHASALW
jgi:hypothetical protein